MKTVFVNLFLGVAILAAAISAYIVSENRKSVARSRTEQAISVEAANKSAEKAEEAKARQLEAEAKAKADEVTAARERKEAAKEEAEAQRLKKANLDAEAKIAQADKKAAEDNAKAAADARAKAEADEKAARLAKEAEEAKAKAAAAEAEKAAHQRAKAEADALRTKNSLIELEQYKETYAERIREAEEAKKEYETLLETLKPEKTVADLVTLGAESVTNRTVAVEDDLTLPVGQRMLGRVLRSRAERLERFAETNRLETIAVIEKLLRGAIADDRLVDAEFYTKALKGIDPAWTLTIEPEKQEQEKK